MKYKWKDYLNALKPEHREKFLKNRKLDIKTDEEVLELINEEEPIGLYYFISYSFRFSNTPEGWNYWHNARKGYKKIQPKTQNKWL